MTLDNDRDEIFRLTQKLLMAATSGDWETYSKLCDPSLTAFEPEAAGNLVDGLAFHQFYFKLPSSEEKTPVQSTIVAPHIRMMGDVAVIAYVRLTQKIDAGGRPVTVAMEETRIWQRTPTGWKHVHFHRSPTGC
jgi:ketosteroid isomerase-like protein